MNAVDVVRYGQGTLLETLEGVPDDAWETPGVCGVWTLKNVIAHLTSYEVVLGEVLAGFVGEDGPTPNLDQLRTPHSGFNDAQVDARAGLTAAETLAELNAAHARVMELLERIPAERARETGTLPWYGDGYALDDLLVYVSYGHKREHAAQIAALRDRVTGGE